jgi:outer membrane protein OmpA-like peptidoglycan-associated protein
MSSGFGFDAGHQERAGMNSIFRAATGPLVGLVLAVGLAGCASKPKPPTQEFDVRAGKPELVQRRGDHAEPYWSYCYADCPRPTQKYEPIRPVIAKAPPPAPPRAAAPVAPPRKPEPDTYAVFFPFGKASPLPSSAPTLVELTEAAAKAEHIEVVGRTDAAGTARRNVVLARQRADAIRKGLVAAGVEASRISVQSSTAELPLSSSAKTPGTTPEPMPRQARRADVVLEARSAAPATTGTGPSLK